MSYNYTISEFSGLLHTFRGIEKGNYVQNRPDGVYNFSQIKRRWHLVLDIIQAHRRAILGGISDSVGECYLVGLGTGA
jgi:hypothetical protein